MWDTETGVWDTEMRGRVCGILRRAKVPRSNLTREQRTALKELNGLKDEVIPPADKGNATVMMRRCDYDGKMEEMLGAINKVSYSTHEGRGYTMFETNLGN